jgi:hypothetical protein
MHLAFVILSLALGLSTGAKLEMNKETDFGNLNINFNDNFNSTFVSLEETRQGECYSLRSISILNQRFVSSDSCTLLQITGGLQSDYS